MSWQLYFDGCCEPLNPGGTIGWGWQLAIPVVGTREGHGLLEPAAENSNNRAEWIALGFGLRAVRDALLELPPPEKLTIYGDSNLVIQQLTGAWRCKDVYLLRCRERCRELLGGLVWDAMHIPRELNSVCDELSKRALLARGIPIATRQKGPP